MHARELVELAAQIATHHQALIHGTGELSSNGIEQYWVASRCRLDRWSLTLRRYSEMRQVAGDDATDLWRGVRPTLEEILISEILTRIWTSVVTEHDKLRGTCELEPVARSILIGHFEARHRTLKLMLSGKGMGVEQAVTLNRLRRRCERWSDTLLAAVADEADVDEFDFDSQYVRDLAADLRDESGWGERLSAWQVVLASLRVSIHRGATGAAANPDLNERIATGIISCFAADAFDGVGLFNSPWMIRISRITTETQCMIEELFSEERESPHQGRSLPGLASDRTRRF